MKTLFQRLLLFSVCFAMFPVLSCSDSNDGIDNGQLNLELSQDDITFKAINTETIEIVVTTANAVSWNIETESPEWLKVSQGDTKFTVSAYENMTFSERSITFDIVAKSRGGAQLTKQLKISQDARRRSYMDVVNIESGTMIHMSDNGRYLIGNTNVNNSFLWDAEEEKVIRLDNSSENPDALSTVSAVANDGTVVGEYMQRPAMYKDGVWSNLDMSMANNARSSETSAWDITPDGKIIIGYINGSKSGEFEMNGLIWRDGVGSILNGPSTAEYPQYGLRGYQPTSITPDGKTILGRQANGNVSVAYLWDENGNATRAFPKEGDIDQKTSPLGISRDGRYILGYHGLIQDYCAWWYDRETGEHYVMEDYDGLGYAWFATSEGDVFFIHNSYANGRVFTNGRIISHYDWVYNKFGIELPEGYVVSRASGDEAYFGGFNYMEGTIFRITAGDPNPAE